MDQFYTKDEISKVLYKTLTKKINIDEYDIILEPSAGKGAFYNLFPKDKRKGIDTDPKCKGVSKQDFFDYIPVKDKTYATIGNPPFGRVCSTAVKFFNHAATFSDIISFIIPRTFKRVSVQNKLNKKFHLIYNEDLPLSPCCFEPKMAAKCCFQIWEKKEEEREIVMLEKTHKDFEFVPMGKKDDNGQPTPPEECDFSIRAYGGMCGEIVSSQDAIKNLRPKSWHFIKTSQNIEVDDLIEKFKSLNYNISKDTVRQNSIGRGELVKLYNDNETQ